MPWLAVPNVSDGRDARRIRAMKEAIESTSSRVVDTHSDAVHNRSVFTVHGRPGDLPKSMASLAASCDYIDLRRHTGVHPRLGRLDVCPIVGLDEPAQQAIQVARKAGAEIHSRTGLPIYFYGEVATRTASRDLPSLRRGGLAVLSERAKGELPPDIGGPEIDLRAGVVCVGVRGVLIAFNVWLRCDIGVATAIANRVRSASGGRPGVRALGLSIDDQPTSQVSMNLIDPEVTGIDTAFAHVAAEAARLDSRIVATEIVGLVPERYLPDPNAQAARLLIRPGRSVESAIS
jgi:glutamate formiminotransferase